MEKFENWIHENKSNFKSEDVFELFKDAIACYNANIIRPAYLLSYQAMMIHFRNLFLQSEKPERYNDGKWTGVRNDLNKDSTWDSKVFDLLKANKDDTIVVIMSNDIRSQFDYWKNLRNDCAHYKENNIIKAHILTLWSFIQQYLLSITIAGGLNTLLDKFHTFYDPSKTPVNSDISPLLKKISSFIRKDEYQDFYDGLSKLNNSCSNNFKLFDLILQATHQEPKDELIKYLEKDYCRRLSFINDFPDHVHLLFKDPAEIRTLWFEEFEFGRLNLKLFISLLIHNMIPEDQLSEAIEHILGLQYTYTTCIPVLNEPEVRLLTQLGYYELFIKKYLNPEFTSSNNKEIASNKHYFYIDQLRNIPLTENVLKNIIDVFSESYAPFILDKRIAQEYLCYGDNSRILKVIQAKNTTLVLPKRIEKYMTKC